MNNTIPQLKNAAQQVLERIGYPGKKHEEWKYTDLNNIIANLKHFDSGANGKSVTMSDIEKFRMAGSEAHLVVFVDGLFQEALSSPDLKSLPFHFSNLASVQNPDLVNKYLGKIAVFENESFVALNTAHLHDGVLIHIPENVIDEIPVHLLYISTSTDPGKVTTVRNLIIAEKNSKAIITESYHSLSDQVRGLTNSVTEVVVKQNANVELVRAQLECDHANHISFTRALQERDSIFDTVTVTLGGNLVRNNLHIRFEDVNSTAHLYGLYIMNGRQLIDNHTLVDHAHPHCFSNELYKGVLDGKSTGVFNGKIFVRQDAQKTNAYQSNKNILLSDEAQMNTKPQLEIFADDVKCTHGATIGQLDEEALFYLRARGIGEKSARTLLNIAFAADVLNNIKSETLRNRLQQLAEEKLLR